MAMYVLLVLFLFLQLRGHVIYYRLWATNFFLLISHSMTPLILLKSTMSAAI